MLPSALPGHRLLIGLITAAVIIAGLHFGRDIVVPLALAFLLGFVLDPLVARQKRLGLGRTPAVIVVVVLTMAAKACASLLLGMQISSLSAQGVLSDISAWESVDSFIGRMLASISGIAAVLDAKTVVVGMQPAVAITLVEPAPPRIRHRALPPKSARAFAAGQAFAGRPDQVRHGRQRA